MNHELRYFVYTKRYDGGPSPELWYGDQTRGTDKFKHRPVGTEGSLLLYIRRLEKDELDLKLDQLIKKFPYVPDFVKLCLDTV